MICDDGWITYYIFISVYMAVMGERTYVCV